MSPKATYTLAAGVGATIGGFVPSLWGGSDFGGWAILTSTIGGLVFIWLAYRYVVS